MRATHIVGLNFSCDGTHYMRWDELLEKDLDFWLGTGMSCAAEPIAESAAEPAPGPVQLPAAEPRAA